MSRNEAEPILEVSNLCAGYGEEHVLNDIGLQILKGEIVALVGSNGAGKTTLLRAISCVTAWQGEIRVAGQSIRQGRPEDIFELGVVQVPEGRQLFDHMSVQDNLLMGAYRRSDKVAVQRDLQRNYQLFPVLAERRRQMAGSLSGGEQQMCAMARALMASPQLLMVDEMSLGLAPVIVDQLIDVLQDVRKMGVTVLLVEQDIFLALSASDRGYVMENGRIVHSGAANRLIDDPEVRVAYLGM